MSSVMVQKYKAILSIFEKKLENHLGANVGRSFLSWTSSLWKAGNHPRDDITFGLTWYSCAVF